MSQSHTDSVTGRALTLYLADGKMTGVVIAKLDNWSGRALVAPYTAFQSLKQRGEYKKSGVYFLMGDDRHGSFVYVGESGDIGVRIGQHNAKEKIDFDRICFFVSMDETLTKGQTCYLEYRLIKMIREAGKVRMKNKQRGSSRADTLPESEKAGMDRFLNKMRVILPVLSFDILESTISISDRSDSAIPDDAASPSLDKSGKPLFFKFNSGETTAKAKLENNDFVVLKGSFARKGKGARAIIEEERNLLLDGGILEAIPGKKKLYRFTRDRAFSSPSRALRLICDYYVSGPQKWEEEKTGKSLRDVLLKG